MAAAAKSHADSPRTTFWFSEDEPIGTVTRTFNAPRALVWRAMTDPKLIAQWWGPRKYKTEVMQHEFQVGGKWRFANIAADGARHEFFGEFREIQAPEKVEQTFCFLEFPAIVETMSLEDHGDETHMTVFSRAPSFEHINGMRASGMEAGATETYERLDEILKSLQA